MLADPSPRPASQGNSCAASTSARPGRQKILAVCQGSIELSGAARRGTPGGTEDAWALRSPGASLNPRAHAIRQLEILDERPQRHYDKSGCDKPECVGA